MVKQPTQPLLARLDDYDDSLLVAGCQRSGTTAVARLFKRAGGIADYGFGHDDELDGALLLAGYVKRFTRGRHCFQTTYLNDRFREYFDHSGFRLIWMVREPRSVVHSMLRNWKRAALDRLFAACGSQANVRTEPRSALAKWFGPSRLDKACASYVAKTQQTFDLLKTLGNRMAIVDYDDLVTNQETLLPQLFEFAAAPFEAKLLRHLHPRSLRKGNQLSEAATARVDEVCAPVYETARLLCTLGSSHGRC